MVEKFKKILAEIKKDTGPVNVFAIIKMDEITDKWSVVFSSPSVHGANASEIFRYLRNLLIRDLSTEDIASIARLGVFDNTENFIQLITKMIKISDGEVHLKDTTLNDYKIYEAYIFESNDLKEEKIIHKSTKR